MVWCLLDWEKPLKGLHQEDMCEAGLLAEFSHHLQDLRGQLVLHMKQLLSLLECNCSAF